MAFVDPTPATFKVNYPEFAGVGDAPIQNAINKSGLQVDQTWGEDTYTIAKELYTAHILAAAGLGAAASGAAEYGPGVKRVKAGLHEIEYDTSATASGTSSTARLFATPYGAEFYQLRRKLFAGPRVIRGGGVGYPFAIWSDVPPQ